MKDVFSRSNYEKVRKQFGLVDADLLASGSTAEVFVRGNHVLRVSTDKTSHFLVVLGEKRGWAVPNTVQDHQIVAPGDYPGDEGYWVGEFERLSELRHYPKLCSKFSQWLDAVHESMGAEDLYSPSQFGALKEAILKQSSDGSFAHLAKTLIEMCDENTGEMDLSLDNFMVRDATNEVLVVDPGHGMW